MNRCVKKIFETRTIISYDLKTKNDGKCQNNHHILNLVLVQTKFAGFEFRIFEGFMMVEFMKMNMVSGRVESIFF